MFLIVEPALPQLREISIVEAYERYVEGSPYGVTL